MGRYCLDYMTVVSRLAVMEMLGSSQVETGAVRKVVERLDE